MRKSFINILSGALGFALPMLLNLFFTPIIVKNLGSEAYGLQSLVNVIIGFLMIADMGLDIPVTRFIAEYKTQKDPKKLNELLNTSLQLYLLIGIIGAVIIAVAAPYLIAYVFKVPAALKGQALNVFYLAGVGFIGGLLSMWGKSIFNGLLRYDISNGINVISNFISLIIGVILVIKGYGVVMYVLSRVLCIFLTGFAYLMISKRFLPEFKFLLGISSEVWHSLKKQVGYGFFLRMSGILTSRIDQTLIGMWIGIAAVGYYSIPILIITSLSGLIGSMIHYIFPSISELHSAGKKQELELLFYRGSRFLGILAFSIFIPFIIMGGKFLQIWVGDSIYENSSSVFVLLLIATFLQILIVSILNCYVVGIGKMKLFTIYTVVRGMVMTISCLLLIKPMGLQGAGWAMIAAVLVDVGYYFFVISKYLRTKIPLLILKFYLKLMAASLAAGLLLKVLFLSKIHTWFTLSIGSAIYIMVFFVASILLKLWSLEERNLLKMLISKYFFKIGS